MSPQARRPRREPAHSGWLDFLTQPRSLVFATLILAATAGGGARLWRGWQARRMRARLAQPDVTPVEIEQSAAFGRAMLPELFQLISHEQTAQTRCAAVHALSTLWVKNDLVGEEEKALVTRAFDVRWSARGRYPRALEQPIPFEATFGLAPAVEGRAIGPILEHLQWCYRVMGARRVSLEAYSPWQSGNGPHHARFELLPGDFPGEGPHMLIFQVRARCVAPGSAWELDLPQVRHGFSLDPLLEMNALLALPDADRAAIITRALHAESKGPTNILFPLDAAFALRGPLQLHIDAHLLPCDLAHAAHIEIEGVETPIDAGNVVVCSGRPGLAIFNPERARFGPIGAIHPGPVRARYRLTPDPALGWVNPGVRSIWPGEIQTDWFAAEILRI